MQLGRRPALSSGDCWSSKAGRMDVMGLGSLLVSPFPFVFLSPLSLPSISHPLLLTTFLSSPLSFLPNYSGGRHLSIPLSIPPVSHLFLLFLFSLYLSLSLPLLHVEAKVAQGLPDQLVTYQVFR